MFKYKIYNFGDKVINLSSENQDKIISNKFILSSNTNIDETEYSFEHFISDKFSLKDFKKLVKDIENYENLKKGDD